jgi:hypothetical protein
VLAPANKSDGEAKGDMVEARWQAVEVGPGDTVLRSCAYLKYVTQTILPLSSARNVKLIPDGVCYKAVGLHAEVLVPATQKLEESR